MLLLEDFTARNSQLLRDTENHIEWQTHRHVKVSALTEAAAFLPVPPPHRRRVPHRRFDVLIGVQVRLTVFLVVGRTVSRIEDGRGSVGRPAHQWLISVM